MTATIIDLREAAARRRLAMFLAWVLHRFNHEVCVDLHPSQAVLDALAAGDLNGAEQLLDEIEERFPESTS